MAKGDIEIAIDADASGAIKGFKKAEDAAGSAAKSIERDSRRAGEGVADVAGETASTSAQVAGAFGDIGGSMAAMGFISEGTASAMDTVGMSIMGITGVADVAEATIGKMKLGLLAKTVADKAAAASQWILNASLYGFPIIWIVAAIAAVIAAAFLIVKNWDKISAALGKVWDGIKWAFSKAWDGIKAAASKVLSIIAGYFLNWTGPGLIIKHWDKIKAAAKATVDWVKDKFGNMLDFFKGLPSKIKSFFSGIWDGVANGLKSALNSILHLPLKIPSISVAGKHIGGQTLIPQLAKGGIVNRPTLALIGEAGPEAVVPLNGRHSVGGVVIVNNIDLHVQGWVGSDQQLVDKFHQGLLKKQRSFGPLGIVNG